MSKTHASILLGAVALVVLALMLIGAIASRHPAVTASSTPEAATATSTVSAAPPFATVTGNTSQTVRVAAMPSYTKALSVTLPVSAEVKAALQSQFADIVAEMKKDSNRADLWLSLGAVRKMAGDYPGAIEDWNYVAVNGGEYSGAAFRNLADLYFNFIKDYPKAESSYLSAIQAEPGNPQEYADLALLYSSTAYHPGTASAEAVLKEGIQANPKAVELQVMLARYYADMHRTADAKTAYDAARANALAQGEADLAARIQQEENSL